MYVYAVDERTGELTVVGELEAKTRLEIDAEPLKPTIMRWAGGETIAARIVESKDAHPGYILLQELCPEALPHGHSFTCARYAHKLGIGQNEAERRMGVAHAHLYQLAYDRRQARLRSVA